MTKDRKGHGPSVLRNVVFTEEGEEVVMSVKDKPKKKRRWTGPFAAFMEAIYGGEEVERGDRGED